MLTWNANTACLFIGGNHNAATLLTPGIQTAEHGINERMSLAELRARLELAEKLQQQEVHAVQRSTVCRKKAPCCLKFAPL
jgi:hypothetical protein